MWVSVRVFYRYVACLSFFHGLSAVCFLLSLFSLSGALGMGTALTVLVGGHQRAAAVDASITRLGVQAGMGKGELAASLANWNALLKIFAPLVYGNLFAWATTPKGPNNIPGLPYFVIASCSACAQLILGSGGGIPE